MAAPSYVAEYPTSVWNANTTPKTCMSAVSISSGDVLIGILAAADHPDNLYFNITENGTASWAAQQSYDAAGSCPTYLWSYTATGNEALTVTVVEETADKQFGGSVIRFSGTAGVGNSNKNQGDDTSNPGSNLPSVQLTTTQDNSAIVVICTDWAAISGNGTWTSNGGAGAATPLTGYPGDTTLYGAHIAYYANAGSQGSKTVGMSTAGQKWNIIAIEVKGTASAGNLEVTSGVGALTAAGPAPTRLVNYARDIGAAALTAAGLDPSMIERSTRYAYPYADISQGAWVASSGSDLFAMINESTPNDTDYIVTNTASKAKIKIKPVADPGSSSGQVVNYRIWSPVAGNAVVRLVQGASTLIAQWTHTGLPTTATTYSQPLSAVEADSITNYDDLALEFEAT